MYSYIQEYPLILKGEEKNNKAKQYPCRKYNFGEVKLIIFVFCWHRHMCIDQYCLYKMALFLTHWFVVLSSKGEVCLWPLVFFAEHFLCHHVFLRLAVFMSHATIDSSYIFTLYIGWRFTNRTDFDSTLVPNHPL